MRTFFWGTFLLHGKFRKQDKHGILFYLTKKNRKQKVGTEGSAHQIHQLHTSQKGSINKVDQVLLTTTFD